MLLSPNGDNGLPGRGKELRWESHNALEHLRMFINEFCTIVDLIVDNNKKIFLGVVLGNILVGILLVRHFEFVV